MNALLKAIPLFRDMSMMELIFLATYAVMGVWGVAVMVSGYLHLNNEYIVRDLKAATAFAVAAGAASGRIRFEVDAALPWTSKLT
ncbi:MAG: hypothetical protein U0894_09185 [Pirellulales bacterium]